MKTSSGKFLPYGRQVIDDEDIAIVEKALKSDWLTSGPVVNQFEQALAEKIGVQYVIACANGTAALHLAALSVGLGEGDIAIVPSITFLATANVVRFTGADVVFSDVDPDTGLMRAQDLEQAISGIGKKVNTVLPVHLNGQCVDLASISKITDENDIKVITDCCHALGSEYQVNNQWHFAGDGQNELLGTFSFHPVKTITMAEGGAITTNNSTLAEKILLLRNHGMSRDSQRFEYHEQAVTGGDINPWYYEMHEPGYNYRISDIQCALGLSQLNKLDRFIKQRRELASLYDQKLKPLEPAIQPVQRVSYCNPALHLYVVLIDFEKIGISRARLMKLLHESGIGTQVHYLPLYRQPYYQHLYGKVELPGAEAYYNRILSLPLHAGMADSDVDFVVNEITQITGL